MTSSPLNLHVHGVHVSPKGNSDNVLLHIPAGFRRDIRHTRRHHVRPHAQATTLQTRRLGEVFSAAGSQPAILGGH
jgi:hypothetical protein